MLSINTATRLKTAGLDWNPALHDFFAIPYQDLDDRYFVISEMAILVEHVSGADRITFNGASEWALDYLILTEAVWVPTESQLRDQLEEHLIRSGEAQPVVTLSSTADGYTCQIKRKEVIMRYDSFTASEAYAAALLSVLGE